MTGAGIELQRAKQKMGAGIEIEYLGRKKSSSIPTLVLRDFLCRNHSKITSILSRGAGIERVEFNVYTGS